MMELKPFAPEDCAAYLENAIEPEVRTALTHLDLASLTSGEREWTAWLDGRPVASGGFIEFYPQRASAWLIVLPMPASAVRALHRIVMRKLANAPYRRIEAQVAIDMAKAHRWMRLLGFAVETPCKTGWLPGGGDVTEYVILKDRA